MPDPSGLIEVQPNHATDQPTEQGAADKADLELQGINLGIWQKQWRFAVHEVQAYPETRKRPS